jgi:hypothetical protein
LYWKKTPRRCRLHPKQTKNKQKTERRMPEHQKATVCVKGYR